MSNLYETLRISETSPTKTFATFPGGAMVTYGDLAANSARYANAMVQCSVKPGDRVAIQAEKCIEMLFVYLATLRIGAVLLPANPAYTLPELDHILRDAEPALLICAPATKAELEERGIGQRLRVETLDASGNGSLPTLAANCAANFETCERADDDLAALLYTSGTTGRPKGAMLSHANLASNALALKDSWGFTADDVLLHALPIFHTHGLFVATNVTLAARASLIFLPRFSLPEVLDALGQATVMMGVPTYYIRLLGDPAFDRDKAASVRLFISGSAPLSADVHREFAERTGHAILERYGMTETNMNTSNPYHGERRAGTVGFPLPGVDIRITGLESGQPLERGEVGMIEISGPNVFKGYWNMPEKSAEEFRDGYFVSGDLGLIDRDGYVHIVGRGKDLIISGGFNIYPAEVEKAIDELPQVRESAVIGIDHPDLGEGVVAVVAPHDESFADASNVKHALSNRLARFKQPREIIFVKELPRNAMGKIQKAVLRERYASLFDAHAS